MSAFVNNTPIVAMFMPVVHDWSRRAGIAPSKLFIPLSYAAILGGLCTLIGTSTNLVVNALMIDAQRTRSHDAGDDDVHRYRAWVSGGAGRARCIS